MAYNTRDYCFFFWNFSIIQYYNEHYISKSGSVSVLRWKDERHLCCWIHQNLLEQLLRLALSIRPYWYLFFNWYSGEWSPIGSTRHCGHQLAYCTSPGWLWWWRNWWNDDWQGKPKYSEKTCPNASLSTTNPTCCPEANPGRRGGKPATNRLSYGTALLVSFV
jgi:hypothetical protein